MLKSPPLHFADLKAVKKADHGSIQNASSSCVKQRLGYLVSCYPAVSHTFILREVLQLRKMGFEIESASINNPDRAQSAMNLEELAETSQTYYVKKAGIGGAFIAHLVGLVHPLCYLRSLMFALRLGGSNVHQILFGLFYFTEALMLDRWMKSRNIHHLHVHFATAASNVALILKHYAPITLSLTVHGPDEFYDTRGQWLTQKIAAADFIICIGSFARSQLMYLSPQDQWEKFYECPLGVDPEFYNPPKHNKSPLKSNNEPFTILCVGRLVAAKGQRILIDACAEIAANGQQIRLVLIGSGPDEAALKAKVTAANLSSLVHFTGALNQQEVREWYQKADLFALASFAEGIPVVLMEAMASGLPCVSTRITGIPELIRDGIDGLLVSPSSCAELVDAIKLLIADEDLRQQLALSGRARIEDKYEITKNITHLGQIFRSNLGAAS